MDKEIEKEVFRLRDLFPDKINVQVTRSEDGGFSGEILTYPKCFTEADSFSELIDMFNDALYTYFDIPEDLIPYMPTYVAPVEMARDLVGFPVRKLVEKISLESLSSETVDC